MLPEAAPTLQLFLELERSHQSNLNTAGNCSQIFESTGKKNHRQKSNSKFFETFFSLPTRRSVKI